MQPCTPLGASAPWPPWSWPPSKYWVRGIVCLLRWVVAIPFVPPCDGWCPDSMLPTTELLNRYTVLHAAIVNASHG